MRNHQDKALLMLRCFLVGVLLLPRFGSSQEALVKSVDAKKGTIDLDQGSTGGFTAKSPACVISDSGKKVVCGKVTKAKKTSSVLRVKNKKKLAKVKEGSTVRLTNGPDKNNVATSSKSETPAPASGNRNFKLGYLLSPVAPSVFNKLTYKPPFSETNGTISELPSVDSLWETAGTQSISLLGVGTELEFAISGSISMTTGLRYRFYRDFIAKTDYNLNDTDQFLEITQGGSAFGLYFDVIFLNIQMGSSANYFRMSSGLDYDAASVSLKAEHKVDTAGGSTAAPLGEVYKIDSKLSTISLRVGSSINLLFLDPLGLYGSLNLIVPVTASGPSSSVTVSDPQSSKVADPKADLVDSLGHKKSSFAAEIMLGAVIAF